ncbi:MAG: ABC transporter permease [Deltaproteobacteria bacterium]|nr:ABC transporter permease [Deltaproteobacteria bacterium]
MIRFMSRRLGFVLLTLFVSSLLIFVATQILPGDVAKMILGRFATPEALENLRTRLGLDRPLVLQYAGWLWDFIRGDWGVSLSTDSPVADLVFTRLRKSAMLALVAFGMYVPLGILLGLLAALRRNTAIDQCISIGSLSFIGLPEFVTGVILITIFAIKLRWLPANSAISPDAGFIEAFPRLILPAITVSLVSLAYITRMTRSSTVEVLFTDYVRTAYLKGLRPYRIILRHVLRNALMPTVTVIAMGVGWLMGGLIVTESLFSYPGLGRLLLFAIQRQDLPLIQAITMLLVVFFSLSNLIADLLYAYLNPRIRYQ